VRHRDRAKQHEDRRPDGGADRHPEHAGKKDDRNCVAHAIELDAEVRPPQQLRRQKWGDGVPGGDQAGTERRGADGQVDRQRAERDRRPHPPAQDDEGDERNPGRRPDRSDLAVDKGQVQAKDRCGPVDGANSRKNQEIPCGIQPAGSIGHANYPRNQLPKT
jgi:hypothetical protein